NQPLIDFSIGSKKTERTINSKSRPIQGDAFLPCVLRMKGTKTIVPAINPIHPERLPVKNNAIKLERKSRLQKSFERVFPARVSKPKAKGQIINKKTAK